MMLNNVNNNEATFYAWLKEYVTINGKLMNLGQLLFTANQRYSNNVALIYKERTVVYQELFYRVTRFAQTLQAQGVKPRDRILLFFENSIEFYIGYYAIAQIGAVVAPLNTFLKEHELNHIIKDAQPKLMIASSQLLKKLEQEHVQATVPVLTEHDMDLSSAVDSAQLQDIPAYLDADEMAALLYTSGTTGLPKGVMLSSRNILTNCIQGIARLGFVQEERVLGVLPFFHSFAQCTSIWAPLLVGCTVIIVPKIERRYILEGLTHKPTIFLGVPALFGLVCLLQTADLASIKYFVSGGDAMPDKIRAGFELIYQRKICGGYGLSETSPAVCADLEDYTKPTSNVGAPLQEVELAIRNENGLDLPVQPFGRIWVKGPNIMLGYYNDSVKTAETIKDGWLDTGDLGYIDEQGTLVITGRLKDLIAHKGFKIYPQEVENIIMMDPGVIRVGVVGQIDESVGEIPVAYVQMRAEDPDAPKRLRELCERHLASYKVPRVFECSAQELPLTPTGTVDKKVLRKNKAL